MTSHTIDDLLALMSRLRDPDFGCPWDLEQSYQSIVSSTLEEVYEVVDAIEQGDYSQLREELGDLLFQVVFYSQLATEEKRFNFEEVVSGITEKLIRRHPHVFPGGTMQSRSALLERSQHQKKVKQAWEKIKQDERGLKGHISAMDDVPQALPALVRAVKLQKRAALASFDWSDINQVYDKLKEETEELQEASAENSVEKMEDELGDVLFTVVNLSRHLKIDPETALRKANQKFEQRYRFVENNALSQDKTVNDISPNVLEQWWNEAKNNNS